MLRPAVAGGRLPGVLQLPGVPAAPRSSVLAALLAAVAHRCPRNRLWLPGQGSAGALQFAEDEPNHPEVPVVRPLRTLLPGHLP